MSYRHLKLGFQRAHEITGQVNRREDQKGTRRNNAEQQYGFRLRVTAALKEASFTEHRSNHENLQNRRIIVAGTVRAPSLVGIPFRRTVYPQAWGGSSPAAAERQVVPQGIAEGAGLPGTDVRSGRTS